MNKPKHQHDGYYCQFLPVFSGPHSEDMWAEVNGARTIAQLREALYLVCCRLQELEERIPTSESPASAREARAANKAAPRAEGDS